MDGTVVNGKIGNSFANRCICCCRRMQLVPGVFGLVCILATDKSLNSWGFLAGLQYQSYTRLISIGWGYIYRVLLSEGALVASAGIVDRLVSTCSLERWSGAATPTSQYLHRLGSLFCYAVAEIIHASSCISILCFPPKCWLGYTTHLTVYP